MFYLWFFDMPGTRCFFTGRTVKDRKLYKKMKPFTDELRRQTQAGKLTIGMVHSWYHIY